MKITVGHELQSSNITNDDGTELPFLVSSLEIRILPDEFPEVVLGAYLPKGSEVTVDGRVIKVVSLMEDDNEDLHTNS